MYKKSITVVTLSIGLLMPGLMVSASHVPAAVRHFAKGLTFGYLNVPVHQYTEHTLASTVGMGTDAHATLTKQQAANLNSVANLAAGSLQAAGSLAALGALCKVGRLSFNKYVVPHIPQLRAWFWEKEQAVAQGLASAEQALWASLATQDDAVAAADENGNVTASATMEVTKNRIQGIARKRSAANSNRLQPANPPVVVVAPRS